MLEKFPFRIIRRKKPEEDGGGNSCCKNVGNRICQKYGENLARKEIGEAHQQQPKYGGIGDANSELAEEGFLHPSKLSGTIVEADEGDRRSRSGWRKRLCAWEWGANNPTPVSALPPISGI